MNVALGTQSAVKCSSCSSSVEGTYKFCPTCGAALKSGLPSFNGAQAPWGRRAVLLSTILFAGAFGTQTAVHWTRGDKRPTEPFQQPPDAKSDVPEEKFDDPRLDSLREQISTSNRELSSLKAFTGYVGELLRAGRAIPQTVALETVDFLSMILSADPNDTGALVLMADLSFEQRAFDKSKLMYERYLALAPDDLGARARLASALTFLKSYDAAISELEKVLAKDPRNFPAKAYYAITMSEKGDKLAALRIGREALAIAPSEEARRRFGAFLASIAGEHPPITGQPLAGGRDSTEPKAQEPGTKNLEEFLRTHPIVAPKIISIDREASGAVLVVLKNFPIEQMPEGVRMKFFGSLEATMVREGAKELRLIDSDSQKTLATIRP